jgi:hypothetical protein
VEKRGMFFKKKAIEKYEALICSESFIERFVYELKEYVGEVQLYINENSEYDFKDSFIIPLWRDEMPEKTEKAYNDYVEMYQNQMWRQRLSDETMSCLGDDLKMTGGTSFHIKLYLTNDISDFDEDYKKECLAVVVKYSY